MSSPPHLSCFVSIDGTDFPILEPRPFNSGWFSHKFKGAGVRYEIGIQISTGRLVWAHGPFMAGRFSDLKIFRHGMKKRLEIGEQVIADGTYMDPDVVYPGTVQGPQKGVHAQIRARHETVNARFRNFFVLNHKFRHNVNLHGYCFHAVFNITHLLIDQSDPLFSVTIET